MKIELHSHTHYSHQKKVLYDGVNSPEEMVKAAAKKLDAIVISDHDTLQGYEEAKKYGKKYGIDVMCGEEITSRNGHILAIGVNEAVPPKLSVDDTVDRIHEQGGIAIAAHPFDVKRVGLRDKSKKCDAVEIFNAQNLDRISNMKAGKFAKKYKLPRTAGSDAHSTKMIGHGFIEVKADDMGSLIRSIKKDHAVLHTRYMPLNIIMDMAIKRLQLSYDHVVNYSDKNYSMPKRFVAKKMLTLVNRYPGRINPLFRAMTYVSLGGVITYSAYREIANILDRIFPDL
ncbi:MAG: PHP domain-containing protein [Candidatus Aenigmarchaeota archaeon]|nr:PHP domain-containing protein [Candidatus Aenigmarchaeota archaeon]